MKLIHFTSIGLLMTASAWSATITRQQTASASINNFSTSATGSLSFQQFDAAAVESAVHNACASGHTCAGVNLTTVDFQVGGLTSQNVQIVNNSGSSFTVNPVTTAGVTSYFNAYSAMYLADTNSNIVAAAFPTGAVFGPLTIGTSGVSLHWDPYDVQTGHLDFATGDLSITGPGQRSSMLTSSDLSAYLGTGTMSFSLNMVGLVNVPGGFPGGIFANSTATVANGTALRVFTYTYDDSVNSGAPEPGTLLLFGTGLGSLCLLRKRARRS